MPSSRPDLPLRPMAIWQNPIAILQNPAIVLIALVLIALALYHQTVHGLVRLWTDPDKSNYQHGLPLLCLCAFLFYRRWVALGGARLVHPSLSAPVLILLASLGWLVANLGNFDAAQGLALILLLCLLVVSIVGYRSAATLAVPLAMLVFAVPIWEPLNPYLQQLTANTVTILLNLTGLPALLEGTHISVPAGTFDVRPACAGVTQVMVGTMVGAAFAYARRLAPWMAAGVVTVAAGVSVLTNTLRIYTTVIIGELTGMHQYAFIKHWAPGWILFGIGMFIFLYFADRLTRSTDRSAHTSRTDASVADAGGTGLAWSALFSLGALAFGPVLLHTYQADRSEVGPLVVDLPAEIGSWRGAAIPTGDYQPVFHNPDLKYDRLYRDAEGGRIHLHVAEYVYQARDKSVIYRPAYEEDAWRPIKTRTRDLGHGMIVTETRIQSTTGAEKLVWQWYYVHGFAVNSGYLAKLLTAWGALHNDPAAAVVIAAADIDDGEKGAVASLTRFVTDSAPTIERALDHLRAR